MAQMRPGRIVEWRTLSTSLSLFRVVAPDGAVFPDYEAGQYIALRRDDCLLTKKVKEGDEVHYVPDLDDSGEQKRGPVTHSYSIASAPFETKQHNYIEFYVVLEKGQDGVLGRWTASLFRIEQDHNDKLAWVERIVGDFTLPKRAAGFANVLMIGTGTGLAPFISMLKQLHFEAASAPPQQSSVPVRYTLIHTNRTHEELAYHQELLDIEASKRLDFVYVPSVSRPTDENRQDPRLGIGRANNLFRHIVGLPPRGSSDLFPILPGHLSRDLLLARLHPTDTVVLTCGNPDGMADIGWTARQTGMRFEKEDW